MSIDPRIVTLTIDFGNGTVSTFTDLYIRANGKIMAGTVNGISTITILNLTTQQRYLLLQKTALNNPQRSAVLITLSAGRVSTGTFILFQGYALAAYSAQPPDIGITFFSLNTPSNFLLMATTQLPNASTVATIAQVVATANNLNLDYQATTSKTVNNFVAIGDPKALIKKLNNLGVRAFIDNRTLVVLDLNTPRAGGTVLISAQTGMVGIPEITTYGVRVKYMINSAIRIMGMVEIVSVQNPAANGKYYIYQIDYDVSNRDEPFWFTLDLYSVTAAGTKLGITQ